MSARDQTICWMGMPCIAMLARGVLARACLVLAFAAVAAAQPAPGTVWAPLLPPVAPPGNPVTLARANLGKTLFWDEQLSSTRTVACGTCHAVDSGGGDRRGSAAFYYPGFHPGADSIFGNDDDVIGSLGVPATNAFGAYVGDPIFGFGLQVTGRRAPTVIDAAYARTLFGDGRAGSSFSDPLTGVVILPDGAALESQALGPPTSPGEMGHLGRDVGDLIARIAASHPLALAGEIPIDLEMWLACRDYPALFEEAFGSPGVDGARVAMSIATYERTLFSDQTPLDEMLRGGASLTAAEERGRMLFETLLCAECHAGASFSDDEFHYIGVRPASEDPGRFAVTGDPDDLGAFRTPTLRHVEMRPPYMHGGQLQSLEEVIEFYDRGGDFDAPHKDSRIVPLGLSAQEKSDLVAWLGRPLNDPRVVAHLSPFHRPALFSEGANNPQVAGAAIPGASTSTPVMSAFEPAVLGNNEFTVAMSGGLGGATATLIVDRELPGATPPTGPVFFSASTVLAGVGIGAGTASIEVPIPNDPALIGEVMHARWYVMDGGWAASEFAQMRIFAPSCAAPACGDCDRSGTAGEILDALAAARFGLALALPGAFDAAACDVDASGGIDVLDALALARFAVGLAQPLDCP